MTQSLEIQDIQVITFDCYGTLIDWEKGAMRVIEDITRASSSDLPPEKLFNRWEEIQFEYIQDPYEPYREILYHSLLDTFDEFQIKYHDGAGDRFSDAIETWQPFPETPGALSRLGKKFKLGIISNIDDDILEQTLHYLGVSFNYLITAERAGFYKPDPEPFRVALEEIGLPAHQVLHTAFGYKYDLGPAKQLGMSTAFVNRTGIVLPGQFEPTMTVRSLTELGDRLEA